MFPNKALNSLVKKHCHILRLTPMHSTLLYYTSRHNASLRNVHIISQRWGLHASACFSQSKTLSNGEDQLKQYVFSTELPSSPYDLSLLYCDGESMVLSWKQPLRSGGADVTDYYIDKCNVAKKTWKEVNVPPIKERLHKVAMYCSITCMLLLSAYIDWFIICIT